MNGNSRRWLVGCAGLALLLAAPAPLPAATGDMHRVVAERANLRAGPSMEATVRGQLETGAEIIELRRERGWLGVRVLDTGQEGWIFGDLVERVAPTMLAPEPEDAGFRQLSEGFDRLVHSLNQELGYPLVDRVDRIGEDALSVTLTPHWLRFGGRDAHLMTALAIYQMWKNHQDQRPVQVTLLGPDHVDYITIVDEEVGPRLTLRLPENELPAG